ncbi:hypothetical protein MNB_SUP05-SYMBIONT-5-972 [hydrothermal vent metagenome]|uniref:Uncharacterized protein n=1 Tax=hydrothermal vent metagenome TaxID=652676 RepID=A0A1W1E1T5_9ZZZZ
MQTEQDTRDGARFVISIFGLGQYKSTNSCLFYSVITFYKWYNT